MSPSWKSDVLIISPPCSLILAFLGMVKSTANHMRTWPVGEPRSILLLWIGRLGDVLIATPLFAALRRRFPQARITLVAAEAGAGAGKLSPDVDELLVLRRFHRPLSNLALAARLAARESDLLIDLNSAFSRASWTLARLARARRKAAFAKGRGDW